MHLVSANELKFNGSAFPYLPHSSHSKQIQVHSSSCCLSSDICVRPTLRNYTVHNFEIIINYVHPLYVGKMHVSDRALEKL